MHRSHLESRRRRALGDSIYLEGRCEQAVKPTAMLKTLVFYHPEMYLCRRRRLCLACTACRAAADWFAFCWNPVSGSRPQPSPPFPSFLTLIPFLILHDALYRASDRKNDFVEIVPGAQARRENAYNIKKLVMLFPEGRVLCLPLSPGRVTRCRGRTCSLSGGPSIPNRMINVAQ